MPEDDDIKVNDKRRFKMDDDHKPDNGHREEDSSMDDRQDIDANAQGTKNMREGADGISNPNFKISFIDLINSLAGTTLIQLGAVADPQTNVIKKDVDAAKQTIDILELLKEKTTGNLNNEESMMLDNVLFDLRMRYVLVLEGKK